MTEIRRQLTLFVSVENEVMESIRARFNPEQYHLIRAHVTLCREDEIACLDKVVENIRSVSLAQPLRIEFDTIRRFADGNGVMLPGKGENSAFREFRKFLLKGIVAQPRNHEPHITLMHPRNSACPDELFNRLTQCVLPTHLDFDTISLIEQQAGGNWNTVEKFVISAKSKN